MDATRHYSEDEENYLCRHFADESTKSIAKTLNRSVRSVFVKAYKLGLIKTKERHSKANMRRYIIRYDNGRVLVVDSGSEAAMILGVNYKTMMSCVSRKMPIPLKQVRVLRHTNSHYGAWIKEYRVHLNTDTMIWPLWYIRNDMAPVTHKDVLRKQALRQ